MTLLDHGPPADTTTKKHHTGLIAVLAVLAVALLAAGAWVIVDRQQQPSFAEQRQAAIMEVVTAHNDAVNSFDRRAILATLTDDATRRLYNSDETGAGVLTRYEYASGAIGAQETFTGDPVFMGDLQVAIPTRREPLASTFGNRAWQDGTYTFTLREVDGQLKIATILWTPN